MGEKPSNILWPNTFKGEWISPNFEPGLVSIIIPTYNRAQLLIEAMSSVHAQTYRPLELIIIDDGSSDDTQNSVAGWINSLCSNDNFKVTYKYQSNKGAPVARNYGALLSKGEYIHFWDSDDIMLPSKIEVMVNAIKEENVLYSVCNDAKLDETNKKQYISVFNLSAKYKNYPENNAMHIVKQRLNVATVLFSRKALASIGPWDKELRKNQDLEYMFRLIVSNIPFILIYKVLHLRRFTNISFVTLKWHTVWESMILATIRMEQLCEKLKVLDSNFLNCSAKRMAKISRVLALQGHHEASKKVFLLAIKRMSYRNRIIHQLHRFFMNTIGPQKMKLLGLM